MSCKVKIHTVNSIPVVAIAGELSGEDSAMVTRKILKHEHEKARAVVVDLRQTTFVDSHGLGAIIYAWRMLEQNGVKLVLLDPPPFVHSLLEGTNLGAVLQIVDTLDGL
jgi:anti-anti-sigma factor